MLPAHHRMRRAPDFASAVRRGGRAGGRHLVVHLLAPAAGGDPEDTGPALVGLIVSRAVGGAVHRTLVKRRLRHVVAARLSAVPTGSRLVVRALPGAAEVPSAVLAAELDSALARCLRPRRPRPAAAGR